MTVLITGGDGYLGWPTALRTADRTEERVVLIDNFARRRWVERIGSHSAIPIRDMDERTEAADRPNLSFVEGDLTSRAFVDELFEVHEPTAVIHTAAQPSAPYSQIDGERANHTQHNNMQATRNLVWGLHENDLDTTHFVETTTTGIYGAPTFPIPEGGAVMTHRGKSDSVPFPALTGSWYHATKAHDAANLRLAAQQFDLPISDVRTAIVYGAQTAETADDDRLATRFDFDYYFGTVAHRFIAQAIAGYPITVYGKGEQRKPFVALDDVVEGLTELAVIDPDDRPAGLTVYNQVTRAISIVEVGRTIADVAEEFGYETPVEHFENPRDEDETHKMEIENERYTELIDGQSTSFKTAIREAFETLRDYEPRIRSHEDRFLPAVLEDREND